MEESNFIRHWPIPTEWEEETEDFFNKMEQQTQSAFIMPREQVFVKPSTKTDVFDDIEKAIYERNPRPIRLERMNKVRPEGETLETFLMNFFIKWNNNRNTIYVQQTEDERREIQTPVGKRRSLADIFLICRYYYPQCTLRDVLHLLYNRLKNVMPDGFRTSYCFTINKRVWYFDEDRETEQHDTRRHDEFGYPYAYYIKNLK